MQRTLIALLTFHHIISKTYIRQQALHSALHAKTIRPLSLLRSTDLGIMLSLGYKCFELPLLCDCCIKICEERPDMRSCYEQPRSSASLLRYLVLYSISLYTGSESTATCRYVGGCSSGFSCWVVEGVHSVWQDSRGDWILYPVAGHFHRCRSISKNDVCTVLGPMGRHIPR